VGKRLCYREKFRKFLTRAEPQLKTAELPVSCPQLTGKVLMQTNSTDGSVHFEGGPFGSLNPPDINNPKRGTPNPEKNRVLDI